MVLVERVFQISYHVNKIDLEGTEAQNILTITIYINVDAYSFIDKKFGHFSTEITTTRCSRIHN